MREMYFLLRVGTEELREKFPSITAATENDQGLDVVCFYDQEMFARDWFRQASTDEIELINNAIRAHFYCRKKAQSFQTIRFEFFKRSNPSQSGMYCRHESFTGGTVVHANVALSAEEKDICTIPVLISVQLPLELPATASK